MPITGALRWALPTCVLAVALTAAPTLAFQPTVQVIGNDPDVDMTVTDLSGRGGNLALSYQNDWTTHHFVGIAWSSDQGEAWSNLFIDPEPGAIAVRESQVTVCGPFAVFVYTLSDGGTDRTIQTNASPFDGGSSNVKTWTSSGVARKPDIACVAGAEVVSAWFEKHGDSYHVRVRTRRPADVVTSAQSFDLGVGTVNRGLAVATSSNRVYVAWFQGKDLKLRRFSIGTGSGHDLTSLGTSTIATLQYGYYPQIGADGTKVILAYMDKAALKVRRSTDRGGSFGSAKTLRPEPFPSEIGAYPTTVAIKGSRVVIGAVEISEGGGKGLGYLSTDGGSSYSKVSSHSSGRIVAALVNVGGSYKYAEAWDQSISDPDPEIIQFRRQ
jgi:hypothetical protein